jgi:hypothetical protein
MGRQDPSLIRVRPRSVSGGGEDPAAPPPALERALQVSRAAPGLDAAAVHAIIRHAHAGNAPAAVTGALIFVDGWFVQLLEGPSASLDACLARIRRDPRHAAVALRGRERALARIFAGQPMALRTRACLDAGLLDAFGYRPGFPVAGFPADILLEFVAQACRGRRPSCIGRSRPPLRGS